MRSVDAQQTRQPPGAGRIRREAQKKKVLSCPFDGCTRGYASQYSLRQHLRWHTGEALYPCLVQGCTKRYSTKGNLQWHLWTHTGQKRYSCPFEGCGQQFWNKDNRRDHLAMHSGKKSWRCPFEGCGQQLGYASNLYAHMRIHTGERPYICRFEGCTKRFRQRAHLNAHQITHTRYRSYVCSVKGCGQIFGQSWRQAAHCVRSHGPTESLPLLVQYSRAQTGPPGTASAVQAARETLSCRAGASVAGVARAGVRAQKYGLSEDAPCRLTRVSSCRGGRRLESVVRRLWRQAGLDGNRLCDRQMTLGEQKAISLVEAQGLSFLRARS